MDNITPDSLGGGSAIDETEDPLASAQASFKPLSERPVPQGSRIPEENFVDSLELTKSTPGLKEASLHKATKDVMKDTNSLLLFGMNQSAHQKLIHGELKSLLEHEIKILTQLMDRCNKFSEMKDENKKKMDDWEAEHQLRMPFYCQYMKQLLEIPEEQSLTQEGVPVTVQQKFLYNIVDKTSDIANNALVQLSLQHSVQKDVELTFSKVKNFCSKMIRHINNWLRMLKTQGVHQTRVYDQWRVLFEKTKQLRTAKADATGTGAGGCLTAQDIQNIMNTVDNRLITLENNVKQMKGLPLGTVASTPAVHAQRKLRYTPTPAPRTKVGFPVGEAYWGTAISPPRPEPRPIPSIRVSPATPEPEAPPVPSPAAPTAQYVEGRIQRSRAAPGQFPDVDLLDVPGMGFPIPRAAMEKGGRQRGTPLPKTPPTPPPQQFGRFMPVAASSPRGSIREPITTPPRRPPSPTEPVDPALLPKIQEDLKRLANRNKQLEEMVNNFRKLRQTLTDEMEKAVKLNQKLQRDLYYVAQGANR